MRKLRSKITVKLPAPNLQPHQVFSDLINFIFLSIFLLSVKSAYANTTYEENLRKQLFETPLQPSCILLKSHPTGIIAVNSLLDQFVLKTVALINKQSFAEIAKLFHSRLGIKEAEINEIFAKIKNTYGQKLEFSTFRIWALNTVDGSPIVLKCADPETSINALYGYNLQVVLWLQIMGTEEIGRIYLPIVFSNGKWLLGGLHVHQWTHENKNYLDWASQAKSSLQLGQDNVAYIEYDLASKLGSGDRFFSIADISSIEEKKQSIMTPKKFEANIKALFPNQNIVHVSPLFVKNGSGILIRFGVDKEISLNEMKDSCNKIKQNFVTIPWSKKIAAIRCSYVLPKEDPSKEGVMGGILIDI